MHIPEATIGKTVIRLKAVPSAIILATRIPHTPAHSNPMIKNLRTIEYFILNLCLCKVTQFIPLRQKITSKTRAGGIGINHRCIRPGTDIGAGTPCPDICSLLFIFQNLFFLSGYSATPITSRGQVVYRREGWCHACQKP